MTSARTLGKTNKAQSKPKRFNPFRGLGSKLSRIGKALLFPIAMLPVAAILNRVGQTIPDHTAFAAFIAAVINAGGQAIFNVLPILFAIGVAFGLSKDSRGEAAIIGFVVMVLLMLIMSSSSGTFGGFDLVDKVYGTINFSVPLGGDATGTGFHRLFGASYNAILGNNVLNGIFVGGFVAYIYNKFNGLELPSVLGFFSGRRFIPVIAVLSGLFLGILYAIIFPWMGFVLVQLSELLQKGTGNRWSNAGIMAVYGFINRLLLPFGMHHIPNTMFWFQLGSFTTANGATVFGDINGFLQGVALGNNAGTFQSGFFPVMMFGLPALAAAIWYTADQSQRVKVLGLLGGSALICFFTGITEPVEFAFLFAAPMLFGLHAVLTGLFGFITGAFGIQLGFGFSAGLIDYILSIPKSLEIIAANKTGLAATMANPGWIWAIGALAAATYFLSSTWMIKKFKLNTPGRGNNQLTAEQLDAESTVAPVPKRAGPQANATKANLQARLSQNAKHAQMILKAVGGPQNVVNLEWCATRLRWVLKDNSIVDQALIKKAGVLGQIKIGATAYQVIIGPKVEILGNEINLLLAQK